MSEAAYFNENDPFAADWLRSLWPEATVDARSIADVAAGDVSGFRRCHFFGGIGGWEYALHLAGWPVDRRVWTGSCPCQPYSDAGKGGGDDDPRNLWPQLRRLITECRPATVFGEQVASRAGRKWLAGVRVDLEALGYAVGSADLCAACAGSPQIRQRLFWVADAISERIRSDGHGSAGATPGGVQGADREWERFRSHVGPSGSTVALGLADAGVQRFNRGPSIERSGRNAAERGKARDHTGNNRLACGVGGTKGIGCREECSIAGRCGEGSCPQGIEQRPWDNFDVVSCRDGKSRRFEPGSFPLAPRLPGRVGRLRGYGNAIVPQVAASFITAFLEAATP